MKDRSPSFFLWLSRCGLAAGVVLLFVSVLNKPVGVDQPAAADFSNPATSVNTPQAVVAKDETPISSVRSPAASARSDSPEAAQRLLKQIEVLLARPGQLTRFETIQLNRTFEALSAQGTTGLQVIREFLGRNEDFDIAARDAEGVAKYPSVRVGLIDLLNGIGTPQSIEIALETLQVTADPLEIALLTRNLEQSAPGEYTALGVSAARESLAKAREQDLGEREVSPLFQVLQSYGGEEVIEDLKSALPTWSYYSSLTLANLPEGKGIPTLLNQLENPTALANGQAEIALQVLAQVSFDHPDAAHALATMAAQDKVSETAWVAIGLALAGHTFEMGTPLNERGIKQLQRIQSNRGTSSTGAENLFSTPVTASWLAEQLDSRIAVVDKLIETTSNPSGLRALQEARESLTQRAAELAVYSSGPGQG